jgi:diguanylate cyclase (GGDEF)-like protein
MAAAALFGIHIIAVRNHLEARLSELAADLEAQRAAERQRADQLRTLREAGHALASDLRLEVVLQTLIEAARRMVDARYAALAVLDEAGRLAHFYTAGIGEAERRQIGGPPQGRGLLGASLRGGAPIRLADLRHDPRSVGFPPHHPVMTTFLGVPIVARGVVMGSLYLTDKAGGQSFSQEDEDLVMGLGADAAIAIENARLFDAVQQLAVTDSLTGLFNRRHFFDQAEREFQRARRYRRPLCAIMLDIDHFKRVNDTYGHAAGDQVLRAVAMRCRKSLREVDILGRYGGEEFVALVPENDLPGTREAAERLRQHVAETPIDTSCGPVAVTISLGVAVCAENCPELAALIAQADQALYAAKNAGRNQVRGA